MPVSSATATQPSPPNHFPATVVPPSSFVIPAHISPPASDCLSPAVIRTRRNPQDFDEKVSLEAYIAQFEVLAIAYVWDEQEMAVLAQP